MGIGIAEGFSTVLEAGFDKMWSVGRVYPFKVLDNGRAKLCTASAPHRAAFGVTGICRENHGNAASKLLASTTLQIIIQVYIVLNAIYSNII